MTLSVVPYRPHHREAALELLTHLWSEDLALNERSFAWKYERNPYASDVCVVLALDHGRVVGMLGVFGSVWEVPGQGSFTTAPTLSDGVVHPDYRGRKIFNRLLFHLVDRCRDMGFPWIVATSAALPTRRNLLATGWRPAVEFIERRRRRPRGPWIDRVFRRLGRSSPERPVAHRWEELGRRLGSAAGVEADTDPRPEAMATLARQVVGPPLVRHVRDEAFFRWRFGNPLCRYRFIYSIEKGRSGSPSTLDGFLVLQRDPFRPDAPFHLVDWAAASLDALRRLIRCLGRSAIHSNVETWGVTGRADVEEVLVEDGFERMPPPNEPWLPPGFLFRPLPGGDDRPTTAGGEDSARSRAEGLVVGGLSLLEMANWDVRMALSDFY